MKSGKILETHVPADKGKDASARLPNGIRIRTWTGPAGEARTCYQADTGLSHGKRKRKSFDTLDAAKNWLRAEKIRIGNEGAAAHTMTDAQRVDAVRAREALAKGSITDTLEDVVKNYAAAMRELAPLGATLSDAVKFYMVHRPGDGGDQTVADAVDAFIKDAEANNLRPASIRSLRYRLNKLVALYGTRSVASFTRQDAEAWLRTIDHTPTTRKHHRVIGNGLFNFCLDREWRQETAGNPFATRKHRRQHHQDEAMPACMTPATVAKIMATAAQHDDSMIPALAVGFFAGLRTAELCGLRWENIDMQAGRITVMPAVAKKRRARHVTMETNLKAWLAPYYRTSGLVAPMGEAWRYRREKLRTKAGVEWPHNGMRHSYASHHLVRYNDAQLTALQLGHTEDTDMLFKHYRSLVTPEDATAYFAIKPTEAAVIQFPKTA